ncbi:MAG: DUF4124 domain-containing protein [Burkholderiales bacterium]|nr:DUF4124 domain-containing protein [Burkholderiales bacterium]
METRPLLIATLLLGAALPVQAEVYRLVDENGRITYTNVPPPDAAGRSEAVEEKISVMGMDPAIRAAAERRFAQQALEEERDWQRRQQVMLAQQAAQDAQAAQAAAQAAYAANSTYAYSYYPYAYSYAPYAYRASYFPAYYRPAVRARLKHRDQHHAPRATHHVRTAASTRSGPAPRSSGSHGGGPRPR